MSEGHGDKLVDMIMSSLQRMTCKQCSRAVHVVRSWDMEVCPDCFRADTERRQREADAMLIRGSAEQRMPVWLTQCGMSPREQAAELSKIPAGLYQVLNTPELQVSAMVRGKVPSRGFGITGAVGVGKTFALAAIVRACAWWRWKAEPGAHEGRSVMEPWLTWSNWPEVVNALRVMSAQDHGVTNAAAVVRKLSSAPVLVLDDFGAERMGRNYTEDWATSQLDLIVDARHKAMLPTWYTTNLDARELVARYGARLVSRLTSANPLVIAPGKQDMRAKGDA